MVHRPAATGGKWLAGLPAECARKHRRWLAPVEPLDGELLHAALQHVTLHHDALRLRYRQDAAGWVGLQVFQQNAPGNTVDDQVVSHQQQALAAIGQSRARQQGLRFTPKDVFEQQTLQRLAGVVDQDEASQVEQGPVTGEAPLLLHAPRPALAGALRSRPVRCAGRGSSPGGRYARRIRSQTLALLPQSGLYNLYGPTEAAIDVTHWTCVEEGKDAVPIGQPIANLQTYVLDGELNQRHDQACAFHQRPEELPHRHVEDEWRFLQRSVEMVVGLLAILKAGGAYVPLDPEYGVRLPSAARRTPTPKRRS